jgi:hypothetical protein
MQAEFQYRCIGIALERRGGIALGFEDHIVESGIVQRIFRMLPGPPLIVEVECFGFDQGKINAAVILPFCIQNIAVVVNERIAVFQFFEIVRNGDCIRPVAACRVFQAKALGREPVT